MNLRKDLGAVTPKELLPASLLASYQVVGAACAPTVGSAWLGVHSQISQLSFRRSSEQSNGASDPCGPCLVSSQGGVAVGSIRKENSPHDVTSLPKAAVRVQSCLHIALSHLLSHLAPHQGAPLDQRLHSCHPILKAICNPKSSRIPGLQENPKCFELSTLCVRHSP